MKNFLIVLFIFSATLTFAQSKIQMEPVKQVVESEDIKKEMKEMPSIDIKEPEVELDQIGDAIEDELELLEEGTETEMKEGTDMEEEAEMKEMGEKEKLKLQPEKDSKSADE